MENPMNIQGTEVGSVTEGLPKGFTYFVRDGDVIKIGSSMKPDMRIASLQTAIARVLEVLAVVPMDNADEFLTHQRFSHLRVRGEWFKAAPELIAFIDSLKPLAYSKPVTVAPRKPKVSPSAMARKLTAWRKHHGSDSRIGRCCSNLLEAIPTFQSATDPNQKAILSRNIGRWTSTLSDLLKAA